ncbi:hypothetical protein TIFTF001_002901 [Ficus carica]|uniref:Uncharacterized protein n=1 Tax=Ficus carica TaxID=3494 RepID=A0AA88CQF2_FICCA|nr:hypothetical protein TIFTF001_002901 [Ficus carica]
MLMPKISDTTPDVIAWSDRSYIVTLWRFTCKREALRNDGVGCLPWALRCLNVPCRLGHLGDPIGLNTECFRRGDMFQVRRHRMSNRLMPRSPRARAFGRPDRIEHRVLPAGRHVSASSGYRQRDRRSDMRHVRCQAADCVSCTRTLRDDVTQTIKGPTEQAALPSRLGCLVWINGVGPGHSMSEILGG